MQDLIFFIFQKKNLLSLSINFNIILDPAKETKYPNL